MSNIFKFHGIGQGLFYSGSIDDNKFNFIYDCGGSTEKLEKEIETLGNKDIDFLVISHLHDDHINGLPILLKRTNIKRIYLPYFNTNYPNVLKALLINNNITPNTENYALILRLYRIENSIDNPNQLMNFIKFQMLEVVNEEKAEPIKFYDWNFNFYNINITEESLKALSDDLEILLKAEKVVSIEEYFTKECEKKRQNSKYTLCKDLKYIFNKLHNDLNFSSIVLMHWGRFCTIKKTLLTGDVRFDENLQKRVLDDITANDRLILQVPHHGALDEWKALWEPSNHSMKSQIDKFVFSFGRNNRYHHPFCEVLDDLFQSTTNDKIQFVYEGKSFEY